MANKSIENVYERLKNMVKKDNRYSLYAYQFVFEALSYTAKSLGKNYNSPYEEDRHIHGRELLEGIRKYGLQQFGFMTRVVFEQWGVKKDSDFGEIVFNLVENNLMTKTETDSRDDFKDVYDFEIVFDREFRFDNKFDIKMTWDLSGKAK